MDRGQVAASRKAERSQGGSDHDFNDVLWTFGHPLYSVEACAWHSNPEFRQHSHGSLLAEKSLLIRMCRAALEFPTWPSLGGGRSTLPRVPSSRGAKRGIRHLRAAWRGRVSRPGRLSQVAGTTLNAMIKCGVVGDEKLCWVAGGWDFQMRDVFLVEDESLIRMMVAEMVAELGHRVVAEAGSIREATSLAQSAQFDVAILDINVAGQSILPVAEILKLRNLPFIFASGYATAGLPDKFGQRPALRKPFLVGELGRAIDALFSGQGWFNRPATFSEWSDRERRHRRSRLRPRPSRSARTSRTKVAKGEGAATSGTAARPRLTGSLRCADRLVPSPIRRHRAIWRQSGRRTRILSGRAYVQVVAICWSCNHALPTARSGRPYGTPTRCSGRLSE